MKKSCWKAISYEVPANNVGTVTGAQSWIAFQVLGDAREKLRAANAMHGNGTMSRLVLGDRRNEQECENTGGNVNNQAVINGMYWK